MKNGIETGGNSMKFGVYLKKAREPILSQRELAKRVGVSHTYISKLENGIETYISEDLIVKIAKELCKDVDEAMFMAKKIPQELKSLAFEWPMIMKLLRLIYDSPDKEKILKRVEELIVSGTNSYYELFHRNKDIMLIIDPETGKIEKANEAASSFYGYSINGLVGLNISQINIMPLVEIKAEMNKVKTEKQKIFIFKHKLSDGTIKDVEIYSTPVDIDDKTYIHTTIYDITGETDIRSSCKNHRKSKVTCMNKYRSKNTKCMDNQGKSEWQRLDDGVKRNRLEVDAQNN